MPRATSPAWLNGSYDGIISSYNYIGLFHRDSQIVSQIKTKVTNIFFYYDTNDVL